MIFARYNIVRFSDSLPIASGLGKQARYNRESLRGQKRPVKPGKQSIGKVHVYNLECLLNICKQLRATHATTKNQCNKQINFNVVIIVVYDASL